MSQTILTNSPIVANPNVNQGNHVRNLEYEIQATLVYPYQVFHSPLTLSDAEDKTLKLLDQYLSYVVVDGDSKIIVKTRKGIEWFYQTMTKQAVITMYGRFEIEVKTSDGSLVPFNFLEYWFRYTENRFSNGSEFNPRSLKHSYVDSLHNSWLGFPMHEEPETYPKNLLSNVLQHFLVEVICDGNTTNFHYLWGLLAHIVQKPYEKPDVLVVLVSEYQGTGKTLLCELVSAVVGLNNSVSLSKRNVVGQFNGGLDGKLVVIVDEERFNQSESDVLKKLVTSSYLSTEHKGQMSHYIPNFSTFFFPNNHYDFLSLPEFDRRVFALSPSTKYADIHGSVSTEYWSSVAPILKHPDTASFLFELLSQAPLDTFNVRNRPKTATWHKMVELSKSPVESWFSDLMSRGYVQQSNGIQHSIQAAAIPRGHYYDDFTEYCQLHDLTAPNINVMGRFLKDKNFTSSRLTVNGSRTYCYLPPVPAIP